MHHSMVNVQTDWGIQYIVLYVRESYSEHHISSVRLGYIQTGQIYKLRQEHSETGYIYTHKVRPFLHSNGLITDNKHNDLGLNSNGKYTNSGDILRSILLYIMLLRQR